LQNYGCVFRYTILLLFITSGVFSSFSTAWELDESPAKAEDWGWRPFEDTPSEINPPPFTWHSNKQAQRYTLEVATDPDFQTMAYRAEALPFAAHCPDIPFTAGKYFWRYQGINTDEESSAWSQTRSFTVPEEAVLFPKPTIEQLLQRIPTEHPRLFLDQSEVQRVRELCETTLAEAWQALVSKAEQLIQSPPDTSEPPLYPEGTEPRGEQWRKIWWGNRVHGINAADAAATLAFVYQISGERRFGEAARDLLLEICTWDPKGSTNYRYNDEAAMPLLYMPSRAFSWAYDVFTKEEREQVIAVMAVRGQDCYDSLRQRDHLWRPYNSHHNRAWHKLGELATVFYDVIPDAPLWLDYAMTIFYTCYPVWGDEDGGWHEGQAYWHSYMSLFMYWALAMEVPFGIRSFDKPFFEHVGDFGLYSCPPGTKSGAFADQARNSNSKRIASLMGYFAGLSKNPYWQWYAEEHGNVDPVGYFNLLMLTHKEKVPAQAPEDLPSSRVFRGTGLAVLNTTILNGEDNIQIHFKSSPFGSQSHGHNANNSFLLNLHGECALIQSGKRDIHGSPFHREWMWQSKSNNAILVNGKGQHSHTASAKGAITHFYTGDALDVVAGEAIDNYEDLHRWGRRILFFKPNVILIHDVLEAEEPATFQWLLHAESPFILGENNLQLETKGGQVEVDFLRPEKLTLSQSDVFDTPPHEWAKLNLKEWHFTAATEKPQDAMEFITLFRIDEADADASITEEDSKTRIELRFAADRATVVLERRGFQIQYRSIDKQWNDDHPSLDAS